MTVFYDLFERHAHGEGLKGHSTHYCPGCGHGLIQKFLAEAIDEPVTEHPTDELRADKCDEAERGQRLRSFERTGEVERRPRAPRVLDHRACDREEDEGEEHEVLR